MKQLFAVLVAAMLAATSFAAIAQDKGGKMDKKEGTKTEKKADKKTAKTEKVEPEKIKEPKPDQPEETPAPPDQLRGGLHKKSLLSRQPLRHRMWSSRR